MKPIILLAAMAMLLTIYDAEARRISDEAEDVANTSASSVQVDADYKIDQLRRRIDDLESELRYRRY